MIKDFLFTTLILLLIYLSELQASISPTKGMQINVSKAHWERKPRFVSFDTNSGKIDINLDLSVPFLSIPLDETRDNSGPPAPLLNVNTKALTVFGLLMALSTFVIPLFVNKIPELLPNAPTAQLHHQQYRSNLNWDHWYFGDSLNEILFRHNHITPCVQRIICTAVATASHSNNSSNVDKIIDGLSRWFEQAANSTMIKEAVSRGRFVLAPDECIATYKDCLLNQQLIDNILKIIGV